MVSAITALHTAQGLLQDAHIDEARHEARLLFGYLAKANPLTLQPSDLISDDVAKRLYNMAQKRAGRYPLQYLMGEWGFLDFCVQVGEGVFIPRADSELVCEAAAALGASLASPVIYDLCSGSGALALGAAALLPSAHVTAVEKYEDALHFLTQNANGYIDIVKADIFGFENSLASESVDIIISNPPYISSAEMTTLEPELSYEPVTALTDGGDGLSYYRYIAREYKRALKIGGYLVFEIGYNQAREVREILEDCGYADIHIKADYGGNPRVSTCKK